MGAKRNGLAETWQAASGRCRDEADLQPAPDDPGPFLSKPHSIGRLRFGEPLLRAIWRRMAKRQGEPFLAQATNRFRPLGQVAARLPPAPHARLVGPVGKVRRRPSGARRWPCRRASHARPARPSSSRTQAGRRAGPLRPRSHPPCESARSSGSRGDRRMGRSGWSRQSSAPWPAPTALAGSVRRAHRRRTARRRHRHEAGALASADNGDARRRRTDADRQGAGDLPPARGADDVGNDGLGPIVERLARAEPFHIGEIARRCAV